MKSAAESDIYYSKKLKEDLQKLRLKMNQHEENIKFLKTQTNQLDDSILEIQVILGKYRISNLPVAEQEDHAHVQSEKETIEHIIRHDKSAASIFFRLKTPQESQVSPQLTNDVLGIVATLGRIEDENLSRLLSEYLGIETMLAVVCKTYNGIKSLETYDKEGSIIRSSGLHGLGASIGKPLDGRFSVICLENLRPYVGEFLSNDSQKRLDFPLPRLPNGETPPGFLGFAVNVIDVDSTNLHCITSNGDGLRETLFYNLFSCLQVYRTRTEMLQALSCIHNGAISLDGGMIRSTGVFSLGNRDDVDVKFPKSFGMPMPNLSENYVQAQKRIKEMEWEKDRILEEVCREQALLDNAKSSYEIKRREFLKFIAKT